MRFLETAQRIIKNTFHHLSRNFWHSLAAVLVTALAIYSVSYFTASAYRYQEALNTFKNKPQLTVFFKDETTEDEILTLKKNLEAMPEVKEVSYISKEEALYLYQEQNRDQPELLEFVTADILPASLEIGTNEIEFQESIARELSNNPRVENVVFHSDVVQELLRISNTVKIEGMVWAGSLLTVSVLTILVIVGISISTFGREIEIMRLVGASSWFISWPFILQGVLYGIISAALAAGLLYVLPYIKTAIMGETNWLFFPGLGVSHVPTWLLLKLWAITTCIGALLGAFASGIATWKHVRT
ncbi:permease-like cell division protein FtsX [Patescibacteria group bacterium]|nr:permease-like cell division protein FtsX [Patescibacteria group bacterium]